MNTTHRSKAHLSYRRRHQPLPVVVLVLITLLLGGCVKVRLLTYPSEFTWIDRDSVKGVMHSMALRLDDVEQLVSDKKSGSDDPAIQTEVVNNLQAMEALAASLNAGSNNIAGDERSVPATNHLLIDEHINDFMNQIMRARLMAESEPPNYYGAGRLVGSCNACHQLR